MRKLSLSLAALSLVAGAQAILTVPFAGQPAGLVTNTFLGANAFYSRGYTGQNTVVAGIEGGVADTSHEAAAGRVTTIFGGAGAVALPSWHATMTATMIGGSGAGGDVSRGIAYGAELWSGSAATQYVDGNGDGVIDGNDYGATDLDGAGQDRLLFTANYRAAISGVNGRTADILSESFGGSFDDPDYGPYISAGGYFGTLIDSVVARSHKLVTAYAGNQGQDVGADYVRAPVTFASGFNTLSVGGTGADSAFQGHAAFSSGGFSGYIDAQHDHEDIYDPSTWNAVTTGVPRVRVDIVAPAQMLAPIAGPWPTPHDDGSYFTTYGGSLAAPQVAGGAALVLSAARDLGYANVDDSRVLAAILMNSTDRLVGWDNGAKMVNGVWGTDQALDPFLGAGQMDLNRAWDQLTAGTHDLLGLAGGAVAPIGYDLGALGIGSRNDYTMSLLGGQEFTATLRFNAEAGFGGLNGDSDVTDPELSDQLGYGALADFRLELLKADGTLLAVSDTKYIATEHFVFGIADSGSYILRVIRLGDRYNLSGLTGPEAYGLAWMQATPQTVAEPAALLPLALGALAVLRRRKA